MAKVTKADRSEHHQGDHLDPTDRAHFWQHPAADHDPYAKDEAPEAAFEPRWLHRRDEDGSILASVHVTEPSGHAAAIKDGYRK